MSSENRKYTTIAFFLLSALIGYLSYLLSRQVGSWLRIASIDQIAGLAWSAWVIVIAVLVGVTLFVSLSVLKKPAEFTDEAFAELFKVTWPSGREAGMSTVAVMVMVTIAAVILLLMDNLWNWLFQLII